MDKDIIETEPIFVRRSQELCRTGGMSPRLELYERRGIDVHRTLTGPVDE